MNTRLRASSAETSAAVLAASVISSLASLPGMILRAHGRLPRGALDYTSPNITGRGSRSGPLVASSQHRSFRKAAAELGVTPSAISQTVRTLEARVGAALLIRTTRSVGLTEAGSRFLSHAKPAFEELIATSKVARDLGQRPTGLLRLTVPREVVPILLEPLIERRPSYLGCTGDLAGRF
jgi:hypothetical protein